MISASAVVLMQTAEICSQFVFISPDLWLTYHYTGKLPTMGQTTCQLSAFHPFVVGK